MRGRIVWIALVGVGVIAAVWGTGLMRGSSQNKRNPTILSGEDKTPLPPVELGEPLSARAKAAPPVPPRPKLAADPIVVENCRLAVMEKVDVPSQRDGVILFIGTDVKPGETIPPDRVVTDQQGKVIPGIRRLKEDDVVQAGQLLARLDDRVARDEWAIKKGKVVMAEADLSASEKARDEARSRYNIGIRLRSNKAISEEELREREFAKDKYYFEYLSKKEAVALAQLEVNQAQTLLGQHEMRSSVTGVIKAIYKNPGEAVKSAPSYEPVFLIRNLTRLRAEGLVDEQYYTRLRKGMKVSIEPFQAQGPEQTLVGHLQEITGVSVSRDQEPRIVSSSLDGTVRVWDRGARREQRILRHPVAVRAVACTPAATGPNLCLSGGADGSARLWDIDQAEPTPVRELAGKHRGAILCVAFSPDGAFCATAGDDRDICLWNTADGTLLYRLTGHIGAVTSVQFTPSFQLVSTARDNTLRLWETLGTKGYDPNQVMVLPRRSGDVTQLGVSPDGRHVMFDPWQSKTLRMLSLPEGSNEGELRNLNGASQFTTFALFSPDGRWILTAGASDGRLQLWRSPFGAPRAYIQRQLVSSERAQPTCAAFAPSGAFMVAGTRDRQIFVWPMNFAGNFEQPLAAVLSNVEKSLDSSSHQVRIWAELDNPGTLLPGGVVNMVRYPE